MNANHFNRHHGHHPLGCVRCVGHLLRLAVVVLGGLYGAALSAQELPQSTACQQALEAFGRAEMALLASPAASSAAPLDAAAQAQRVLAVNAQLYPFRQRVADVCLGGMTTSPPPSQRAWTGAVPARPVPPDRAVPSLRPAPGPLPNLPPRPEPPVMVSNCNGATCLGSDGSTLTRVGPNLLMGPRGVCTQQGLFLRCP
ncbi:hypothetical protein DBR42_10665 [Pelomonas sp. HMWF004]|nr:hypothetical protein DBR42_10665 [Pelomonas sp. HMWF004]